MAARNLVPSVRVLVLFAWSITLAIGVGILVAPAPGTKPLVSAEAWQLHFGFVEVPAPSPDDIAFPIAGNTQARFFRSWVPTQGAVEGRLTSGWFYAGAYVAVPLVGYPSEPGIRAELECQVTAARLALATGNSYETWVTRVVRLPRDWCTGAVRLTVESSSKTAYVGVGTPFSAGWLDYAKGGFLAAAAVHATVFLQLGVLLLGWAIAGRRLGLRHRYAAAGFAVAASSALAFAAFFIAYFVPRALLPCAATAFIWSLFIVTTNRHEAANLLTGQLGAGALLFYWTSVAYLAILYAADVGVGPASAGFRFRPPWWSTDNLLPSVVAEGIFDRRQIGSILGGHWRVSDRPPLLAGWMLLFRPVSIAALLTGQAPILLQQLYLCVGILAQSAGVTAVVLLARGVIDRIDGVGAVALAVVIFSPFFLFNSIYAWPKLMAAGYAILGTMLLFEAHRNQSAWTAAVAIAGALFGLSALSHAGVAFGFVALPVMLWAVTRSTRVWSLTWAATVSALLWLPWSAWQKLVDPPGNALTKFALAGTFGFDDSGASLMRTVRDAYGGITWADWIGRKWFAIKTLFGTAAPTEVAWVRDGATDAIARARVADFLHVFPAMRFFLLAIVVGILVDLLPRANFTPNQRRVFYGTLAAGLVGLAVNVLVTWSVHVQHHQSYFSICLLYIAALSALAGLPKAISTSLVGLQAIYVVVVWLIAPMYAHRVDALACVAAMLSIVMVIYAIARYLASARSMISLEAATMSDGPAARGA